MQEINFTKQTGKRPLSQPLIRARPHGLGRDRRLYKCHQELARGYHVQPRGPPLGRGCRGEGGLNSLFVWIFTLVVWGERGVMCIFDEG
jgi:hypothetical protein